MTSRLTFPILCLAFPWLLATAGIRTGEPKLVQEIRAGLPEGWECGFEPGASTKYVAAGMSKPEFVIVITHPKIVIATYQHPTRGPLETNPLIPLCFYKIAKKPAVLRIIEEQRIYSWSIPTYFGETDSHFVVTSPAWVNGGKYRRESRRSIRAPMNLLTKFIHDKEGRSIAQRLLSDHPDTVEAVFNKTDKRFPNYSIPNAEKAFTVENDFVRRLTLPGEKLMKPIIVRPKRSDSFAEPWEVLARYMEASPARSVGAILPLYDEPSQQAIIAMPPATIAKALELVSQFDSYEFWLITYRDDFVIAYGYEVQSDKKQLTHVTFRRIGKEYRMIAGTPPFSFAYNNALMNLLADQGFRAVTGAMRE